MCPLSTGRSDFAGKAYAVDAVRNELLFITFIEGLANSVVRWEVRKAKSTVVEDAVSLALEMQSYLNLHSQQRDTSAASVNNLTSLRRPKVNSFPISFSPSRNELNESQMNRAVRRNKAAVVNVLPAIDSNNRSLTTTQIKVSAAIGTNTKEIAPIVVVVTPTEANRTLSRIGWVPKILAPTPR